MCAMYVNSGLGLWDRIGPIWRIAFEEAWAAYVAGTVPVGAVLVDVNGAIVSRGRNRIFDNAVAGHIGGSRLAHAEVNALLGLTGSSLDPRALALYTTTEPCPLCIGAVVMANVREIRYAAREPYAGSITVLDATSYIRSKKIRVIPPEDPDAEAVSIAMGNEFHLRGNGPRVAELVAGSLAIRPDAVALADRLHAAGRWAVLRRMSAREGIADLLGQIDLSAQAFEGPSTPSRRKKYE
ncbi:MAG: nucleoside deaminase [Chloroflexi bacterium]|nr:MAG: nucleoside deaminase [Chloroflexota bacterium]